jgi:hypothetical protein
MDHEYCKQHSRPMSAPAMAAIPVRREPSLSDLTVSLRAMPRLTSALFARLIIVGINGVPFATAWWRRQETDVSATSPGRLSLSNKTIFALARQII